MKDTELQLSPPSGAQPQAHQSLVKLPAFWKEDPVLWFCPAEGQFTLRNVADPIPHFYHILFFLSQDVLRLVRHVLHEETDPESHNNLRTLSLGASHSLSNYQKMEQMMKLPPLVPASGQ